MHRFTDTDDGLAVDITTPVPASWFNAVQEEISYVIEQAGLTLNNSTQDDGGARTQLYSALVSDTLANAILDGAGVTATATEINTACDGITATANEINLICDTLVIPKRAHFSFSAAANTTVSITPGAYPYLGRMVYWAGTYGFVFGSGGSNGDSEDLGASEWHYLYIDGSAIGSDNLIASASKFVNSTTAPTWSSTQKGWYNGADLCIFAVYTTVGSVITMFAMNKDLVQYQGEKGAFGPADVANDWSSTATFIVPAFCRQVLAKFLYDYQNADNTLYYRHPDATDGVAVLIVESAKNEMAFCVTPVITDENLQIEIKDALASTNAAFVSAIGWYFPQDM